MSNQLSLFVTKTKYSFFYKPSKKNNVPLVLPKLSICNNENKRYESVKFLGVFLDENLTQKDHIKYTENRIVKNIVFLFRSKPNLAKKQFLLLYYSYIYTHTYYANIAWGWGNLYIKPEKSQQSAKTCTQNYIQQKKYETVWEWLRSINNSSLYQINS